ncbi:MAG: phage tail protein [[Eubacterium] rectale]|nr:phage tail protein [Agathobacter rectalis]
MSEAEKNKVQFNLKNVHYAAVTSESGKSVTYGTPVAIPGAVSLTLDPEGGVEKFYADGIVYYQSTTNNGYSGDCEVARFPDQMLVDIWQYVKNNEGVIVENADVEPKEFALLYQIDGDKNNDYYLLYRCTGTRPGIGGETNGENKEVKTRSSTISAVPRADGFVMARTTETTSKEIKDAWFTKVYEKENE